MSGCDSDAATFFAEVVVVLAFLLAAAVLFSETVFNVEVGVIWQL